MVRRLTMLSFLAVIAAVAGTVFHAAADPPAGHIPETEILMRAKLTSSQKVLEGLLAEDYKLVAQGAREMARISEAGQWPQSRDAVYEHFAAEFRRQCNKLERLAGNANHDGATFTYMQTTTTCIDCHNYVRDSLRIAEQPDGGVQLIPAQLPEN